MRKILIQTTPSVNCFSLLVKWSTSIILFSIAVLCFLLSISPTAVAQSTFTNATPISDGPSESPVPCLPYPSGITVSGLASSITKVTVTLDKVSVDFAPDANVLLVGPNGRAVMLLSDAPGAANHQIPNMRFTFDDTAPYRIPGDLTLTSGTYKPTNFVTTNDSFPPPAPRGPYGDTLAVFNGADPNGFWALYVVNDRHEHVWDYGGVAIFGGWSLTITVGTQPPGNPIDDAPFFIRQHYVDFLNREPEPTGLNAWLNVLSNCPPGDLECLHQARITTSGGFFGSQEFRLKGYFVYRLYKLAFNRLPEFAEISRDMQSVTGQTPADVYTLKAAFTNAFVQRQEFARTYDALSNANFVSELLGRYDLESILTPDPINPDGMLKVTLNGNDLLNGLDANTLTRPQVLRAIADSDQVFQLEYNPAFVAMQYYGYLRRTPEPAGYQSWLNYLNTNPRDFRTMIRGFVDSLEYRQRFDGCAAACCGCWDY